MSPNYRNINHVNFDTKLNRLVIEYNQLDSLTRSKKEFGSWKRLVSGKLIGDNEHGDL